VGHPFEDLMGILALESQRNECVIIGEDLGLPPPGYEEIVAPWKVFSYNMIHYANKQLVAKATASSAYKPESLTVFSNHDKPTLKGMFNGWYPKTIERLGIITAEERDKMIAIRQRTTLESIINQMQLEGYLTRPWTSQHWYDAIVEDINVGGESVYAEFVWALHAFLAFSSAKLVGVQLEDLLGQDAQVNIPGTADADVENPDVYPKQYPNWRIRLSKPFEALENEALFYEVIGTLSEARGNGNNN
jgi:4-alpha-glucanotransferase